MGKGRSKRVETLGALDRPERLLLWGLRAIAIGRSECPGLAHAFFAAWGYRGGQVLGACYVLVKCIALSGRRRLSVHVPGCNAMTPDEAGVLKVIAAAQVPDGDDALLRSRLRRLVESEPEEALVSAVLDVGQALKESGCILVSGSSSPDGASPQSRLATIH